MRRLMHPRDFQHVESTDQIGLHIGAGGLKAVAHAGLRGEVHNQIGPRGVGCLLQRGHILQHRLMGGEVGMLAKQGVAIALQADIVIIRHAVKAMHHPPRVEQMPREVKTDKTRSARNQRTTRCVHEFLAVRARARARSRPNGSSVQSPATLFSGQYCTRA